MPSRVPAIAFIGGGPRTAGVLERLAANRPELFGGPLHSMSSNPMSPAPGGSGVMTRIPGCC